ncbi:hypothetical protein RchiOBHm_Chr4g0428591 [Rosa chinensis]|uniref:Thionin-like protein n=1 Tax=Rosa chinensis TaxID=74649 RepID=A0A2P6QZY4_ROSCH|nr:hypothetical protein RchiOBHm_Chr4g0428591 [Rosa chinensis]
MATSRSAALVLVIATLFVLLTSPDAAARANGQVDKVMVECLDACTDNVLMACIDMCDPRFAAECRKKCRDKQAKCTNRCMKNEPAPRSIAAACP